MWRIWEYKGYVIKLSVEEIYCICKEGRKTYLYTRSRVYRIGSTLKEEEALLRGFPFTRTHNAYLVHLKHLECIGRQEAVLRNGIKVPVSEQREKKVKQQLKDYVWHIINTKNQGK